MNGSMGCEETRRFVEEELRKIRKVNRIALGLAGAVLAGLFALTLTVEFDVSVPATGRIQAADAKDVVARSVGQVVEVLVEEGDEVDVGEELLRLENPELAMEIDEAEAKLATLQARKAEYGTEIRSASLEIDAEVARRKASVAELQFELSRMQAGGNPKSVEVLEARLGKAMDALDEARQELQKAKEDAAMGLIPGNEVDRAETKVRLAEADLRIAEKELGKEQKPYSESEIEEAKARLAQVRYAVVEAEARWGVVEVYSAKSATLTQEIRETETRLEHLRAKQSALVVVSPAVGKVLTHAPSDLEGVWVNPGDRLLTVGTGDGFVVEAEMAEEHTPGVAPPLPAKVYLRAFPFRDYELLEGELIQTAEQVRTDGKRAVPVRILLRDTEIQQDGEVFPLRPGLSADVEIIVRQAGVWTLVWETIQKWRSVSYSG